MTTLSPDSPRHASLPPGRLQTLLSYDEEGLGIRVEAGRVPAFLLEANQRLREGRIEEAGAGNPEAIGLVPEEWVKARRPPARAVLLVS